MNTQADFIPSSYYHVYNQTNGREALFKNNENRRFFLSRFAYFLKPFVYVHPYALMSNHFHFSVQVKSVEEIREWLSGLDKEELTNRMREVLELETSEVSETSDVFHKLIVHQFQRFFVSYTKSFNKAHNRSGSLFRQKFKRSEYNPEIKFHYLQYHIHHNARKHGVVENFTDYQNISYFEIINSESSFIDIDKVYEWFSTPEAFIQFHTASHYEEKFKSIEIDEEV